MSAAMATTITATAAGFQRVLAKFQSRLTADEINEFKYTDLTDVQQAIIDIQAEQARRKGMKNLTRVAAFVEAMEQFGKVVEVFLNTSSILCFVWGPIKFLLQVASVWSESFDVLLDAYTQITENIPLLLQYRKLFEKSPEMGKVLELIYEDILEFHQSALRMFGRSTLQQLFRSAWKSFKTRFQHILGDLQRHKILIESQANILQMMDVQETRTETVESFEKLSKANLLQVQAALAARVANEEAFKKVFQADRDDQFVVVRNWLSAVDSRVDHEGYTSVRCKNPGHWILRNETIKAWMDTKNTLTPIVWLNGIPGAGKTILASRIIEEAQENPTNSVLCFYFKHKDPQRNTFVSAARSILVQLLTQKRDQDVLPYLHEQSLNSGEITLLSMELAKILLTATLESLPKDARVFLVLDGIDECNSSERKAIISTITSIINKNRDPGKIRALFVSQYEPEIKGLLRSAHMIKITGQDNENEIREFAVEWITKIAAKFKSLSADKQKTIETTICDGAEGMFLFAKLVLKNLHSQTTLGQLYRALLPERFPKGLNQAYARITEQIYSDENTPEQLQAQKLLAWILCAKRPLKWHEIQGAMSIDFENETVDFEEGSLVMDVEELCGSLVERFPGDRIELVHSTAKTYLVQDSYVRVAREEGKLATICMQYLTFKPFCQDSPLSNQELSELADSGYFAFQDYATLHWVDHLQCFLQHLKDEDLQYLDILASTAEDFLELHGAKDEVLDGTSAELHIENDGVRSHQNFRTLQSLIHGSRRLRAQAEDLTALGTLGDVLSKTRAYIEKVSGSASPDSGLGQEFESFYGSNLYKCPRHLCFYFHEGYQDRRRRDQHVARHDRPFCCSHDGCSRIQTGFSTPEELKKHLRKNHPDRESLSWKFPKPPKESETSSPSPVQKIPASSATFQCTLCPKRFTRAHALKSHVRTHTDERPFVCMVCGKGFARLNDQKRHESHHLGERKFVCKGILKNGTQWGCGLGFARRDGLGRHFRSEIGRVCMRPMLDEEQKSNVEISTPPGMGLSLSESSESPGHRVTEEEEVEDVDYEDYFDYDQFFMGDQDSAIGERNTEAELQGPKHN